MHQNFFCSEQACRLTSDLVQALAQPVNDLTFLRLDGTPGRLSDYPAKALLLIFLRGSSFPQPRIWSYSSSYAARNNLATRRSMSFGVHYSERCGNLRNCCKHANSAIGSSSSRRSRKYALPASTRRTRLSLRLTRRSILRGLR